MRVRLVMLTIALLVVAAGCGGDAFVTRESTSPPPGDTTSSSDVTTPPTTTPPTTQTTVAPTTTQTTAPTTTQATTTSVADPQSPTMQLIQDSGVLRVGTFPQPLLPWADPGAGIGFEPDLAQEIAERLFDDVTVTLVPLTAPERFESLGDGMIDILMRGTAHTTSRADFADFSVPYLLDGVAVVVGDTSGLTTVDDLNGTVIAVLAGTTLELEVRYRLATANVSADFEPVDSMDEARAAFAAGAVDGYVDSWLYALNGLDTYSGLRAIWLGATDPIAVAVRRGDPIFVDRLDETLRQIIADGTWDAMAAAWFPAPVPWTTEEMLTFPPADR